jgi:hypothetical protein
MLQFLPVATIAFFVQIDIFLQFWLISYVAQEKVLVI